MHRYASEERVILENGVLCRVVTAVGLGKGIGFVKVRREKRQDHELGDLVAGHKHLRIVGMIPQPDAYAPAH